MPTRRYFVLELPGLDPLRSGPGLAPAVDGAPLAPRVTVADLSPAEAKDAAKAPTTLGVGRAGLPLSLVRPVDVPGAAAAAQTAWGLEAVGALQSARTGAGVRVAVLDTGCDVDHAAFAGLKAANRIVARNFTAGGAGDVTDVDGHGTHCAGTVCGGSVGGTRIGVAPGVDRLIVGKVLGPGGGGNDTLIDAMVWAAAQGARVISMSLGLDFPGWVQALHTQDGVPLAAATSMALRDYRDTLLAFDKLVDLLRIQDVLVVAATGNESERAGGYTIDKSPPAATEHVLSVAAAQQAGGALGIADFSNTGADLAGPGVGVLSAKAGGGLVALSGTSMATPHVAGVAALWAEHLAAQGPVRHATLQARLLATARPIPGLGATDVGSGLVTAP